MTEWEEYVKAAKWGEDNCIQDAFENAPFESVGGLEARNGKLRAPKYVPPEQAVSYLAGYISQARAMYGTDWATVKFGWYPAIEIKNDPENDKGSKEES